MVEQREPHQIAAVINTVLCPHCDDEHEVSRDQFCAHACTRSSDDTAHYCEEWDDMFICRQCTEFNECMCDHI